MRITDKSTYSIMGNDFHVGEDTDMKWYFGLSDGTIDMTASVIEQYSTTWLSNWWVINSKGEIYSTEASTAAFFSYPINKLNGKEEFEAAPFIGVSYTYNDTDEDWNYNYAMVFYDKTNRQFLSKFGANNYPDVMKCTGTQIFDVKTGRDMVFMDSHVEIDGLQVAVLKDPQTQDFYLYGFTLGFGKIEQNFYGNPIRSEAPDWLRQGCYSQAGSAYFRSRDNRFLRPGRISLRSRYDRRNIATTPFYRSEGERPFG